MKRDFLLVAIATAFGSVVTWFAGANNFASNDVLHCEVNAAAEPVATLVEPAAGISRTVALERTGAATSPRHDSTPHDGADRTDNPAHASALAFRQQQELEQRFSSLLADDRPGAIAARIENRFYSEEWNQEWAGSQARKIRALFDANENLSGIAPLQVTCRSKNCQVVLAASNQEQVRTLSQKFMRAARNGDAGMKDEIVSFFPDTAAGSLVFYLSESGNTDLFQ
jgi:hypothetical protein